MLRRWVLPDFNPESIRALSAALGIGAPAAKVLASRGLADPDAARCFLRPAFDELHDPLRMPDMVPALDGLQRAIDPGARILIYGDYDGDGPASVGILTRAIEVAGGRADFHAPHRL